MAAIVEFKKPTNPRATIGTKPVASRPGALPLYRSAGTPPTTANIPKNSAPRARRYVFTKKAAIIGTVILLTLGLYYCFTLFTQQPPSTNQTRLNPGYPTVLPSSKTISGLGGWQRISPPGSEPVYAYADTIDGVAISVSQQPLPVSFKTNTKEQVAELAKKFNATTQVQAGSTTLYIGTSAKGPQSVIFIKETVLILIKSQQKIKDTSWQQYAESLNNHS